MNGTAQYPMDGVSMLYAASDANAPGRRTTQYFEMFGNRGHLQRRVDRCDAALDAVGGCRAPAARRRIVGSSTTWTKTSARPTTSPPRIRRSSRSCRRSSRRKPSGITSTRSTIARVERFDATIAGRPDLMGSRTSLTLYEGMTGIMENAFINVKGRSYNVTADVEVPAGGASGVIIAQAGRFGGWSLYMKGGRAHYVYNFGGLQRFTATSKQTLTPGRHTLRYEFVYDGGPPGSGGTGRLLVDGQPSGEVRVLRTMPFAFSARRRSRCRCRQRDTRHRRVRRGQQSLHRPHSQGDGRHCAAGEPVKPHAGVLGRYVLGGVVRAPSRSTSRKGQCRPVSRGATKLAVDGGYQKL